MRKSLTKIKWHVFFLRHSVYMLFGLLAIRPVVWLAVFCMWCDEFHSLAKLLISFRLWKSHYNSAQLTYRWKLPYLYSVTQKNPVLGFLLISWKWHRILTQYVMHLFNISVCVYLQKTKGEFLTQTVFVTCMKSGDGQNMSGSSTRSCLDVVVMQWMDLLIRIIIYRAEGFLQNEVVEHGSGFCFSFG